MSEQRDARGVNYSFMRIKGKIINASVVNLLLFSVFGPRQDAGDKRLSHQFKLRTVNFSAKHKYVDIRTRQRLRPRHHVTSRPRCMFLSVSYSRRGCRSCDISEETNTGCSLNPVQLVFVPEPQQVTRQQLKLILMKRKVWTRLCFFQKHIL